ncbi:hypothetical protein QMK33_20725 [Hymenobacter sp. H14-R3]|uniref:hypothetical protein n=1 Tax=Hymenobacter sp. H14-R3 TaxID=3046308 RepID=UPI0024BA2C96|nr:hypothetical protein [Hymenobacter sp. H14-R3]MDJ0367578.1 hypothetical protein [Hymenobacter sp. H14-R3]
MKKTLLFLALGLTAAGSWAFYPKAPAAPGGYLMLIGSGRPGTESSVPELTIIQPDGQRQVQRLPTVKSSSDRSSTDAAVELHRAELVKLNTLYAQGWRLVNTAQSTVGTGATTETIYLLERK